MWPAAAARRPTGASVQPRPRGTTISGTDISSGDGPPSSNRDSSSSSTRLTPRLPLTFPAVPMPRPAPAAGLPTSASSPPPMLATPATLQIAPSSRVTRASSLQLAPTRSVDGTASTAAIVLTSIRSLSASPLQLLYIEAHKTKRDTSFCQLCRCALKPDEATIAAHLTGRRHLERSRSVERIRVTLTLVDDLEGGQTATARFNLGLAPAMNLQSMWKYSILLLRQEQRALRQSKRNAHVPAESADTDSASAYGILQDLNHVAVQNPSGWARLAQMRLEGEFESMHPNRLKLKYLDGQGHLRPLYHSSDFVDALRLLAGLKKIDLVVQNWNLKKGITTADLAAAAATMTSATAIAELPPRPHSCSFGTVSGPSPTLPPIRLASRSASYQRQPLGLHRNNGTLPKRGSFALDTSFGSSFSLASTIEPSESSISPLPPTRTNSVVSTRTDSSCGSRNSSNDDGGSESSRCDESCESLPLEGSSAAHSPDPPKLTNAPPSDSITPRSRPHLTVRVGQAPSQSLVTSSSPSLDRSDVPCRFFEKNSCKRVRCPFQHVTPAHTPSTSDEEAKQEAQSVMGTPNTTQRFGRRRTPPGAVTPGSVATKWQSRRAPTGDGEKNASNQARTRDVPEEKEQTNATTTDADRSSSLFNPESMPPSPSALRESPEVLPFAFSSIAPASVFHSHSDDTSSATNASIAPQSTIVYATSSFAFGFPTLLQ